MNMKATSVELAVFKLKPGVSEAQFQRANQLCNQWLETCYGFIGRVLARPPEGQIWHDIVEWADLGCAKAAAEDFWHAPSTRDFIACVDCDAPETTLRHLVVVERFARNGNHLNHRQTHGNNFASTAFEDGNELNPTHEI
jgi:hypothetical protein